MRGSLCCSGDFDIPSRPLKRPFLPVLASVSPVFSSLEDILSSGEYVRPMRWITVFTLALALSCGGAPPPKEPDSSADPEPKPTASTAVEPQSSAPPEPPLAKLKTGTVRPKPLPLIQLSAAAHGSVDGFQVVRIDTPTLRQQVLAASPQLGADWIEQRMPHVSVEGGTGFDGFWAGKTANQTFEADQLWLRRAPSESNAPVKAKIWISGGYSADAVDFEQPIEVSLDPKQKPSANLQKPLLAAMGAYFARQGDLAFAGFAQERLAPRLSKGPNTLERWQRDVDWAELMEFTTGIRSVREAVQTRSKLRSELDKFRPTIPIEKLTPPEVIHHPWPEMLQQLGKPVPVEPLAKAAPADFYYARSNDITVLFGLLDEVDAWGTPLVHLMNGETEQRHLAQRYRTQLALPHTELTRLMGPKLIQDLALVGSDPFLRQGSDVTLIFQVKNRDLFLAGLQRNLKDAENQHGTLARSEFEHQKVKISLATSSDGQVSRYQASHQGFVLVSNSKTAITRVIDTLDGRHPSLDKEVDFKYMLARDGAVQEQLLIYLGDRFIESALSPRSRVLDGRRQLALSELQRPAFAALLHGWVFGAPPKDNAQLLKSKLMLTSDLKHFDGSQISFAPGKAPRSPWGTVASATPLIDLAEPKLVTASEQDAYQRLVQNYQRRWSEALDPIALRVRLDRIEDKQQLTANLRVLPLINDREYREVAELVGNLKLDPGQARHGARILFAIAEDSELRRELTRGSRGLLGKELKLDWLGHYGMVGILDRTELPNALAGTDLAPEPPSARAERRDELDVLRELPLYAALAVKKRASAALLLTFLRTRFDDLGAFKTEKSHRGYDIVSVTIERELQFYYALSDHALYLSLKPWVIEQLLDDESAGQMPKALNAEQQTEADSPKLMGKDSSGQFVLDVRAKPNAGLQTAISWLFEAQSHSDTARADAAMLLLGAPSTQQDPGAYERLSLNYLGAIPLTVDGKPFVWRDTGVADPLRGNDLESTWPELPIAGSPSAKVLEALEHFRAQLGFDLEPGVDRRGRPRRSLSATVQVQRR